MYSTFGYVLRLFKKGYKNEFEQEDLYEVPRALKSEKLGAVLERQWKEQKNPNLVSLLCKSFGICYFSLGLMKLLANTLFLIIHPYALSRLLSYFSPGQQDLSKTHAYFYATLVTVFSIAQTIFSHNYFLFLTGLGIRIRTALCSFLYRRLMSSNDSNRIPFGRIVTLLTKDIQTFESFVEYGNELWIGTVKLIASSYILYDKTGPSGLVGLAVFAIAVPLHGYLGQNIMLLKKRMCEETDERLQTTHEALSAIKSVKMNTWEDYVCSKVSEVRKKEVQTIFEIKVLTFIGLTIGGLTSRAAVHVLIILTHVWFASDTSVETIFFSLNCYYLLSDSLTTLLPLAVYKTSELVAAIKRLEEFVKLVENPHREQDVSSKTYSKRSLFGDNTKNEKLENGLTVVTGPTGGGKTLLLKTTLETLHQEDRSLVQKSTSYVSQEPWFFPSTVRQNILFGGKYEEKRYQTVLEVCDLLHDLEAMENGDLTIIQNSGLNLSKNQQVKINLARGVYKKSDIYLIDDCLSLLDAQMNDFIFNECVLNFLQDKTVVLVSHKWEYLEQSNKVVIVNNGGTVDMANTYEFKNISNGDKMFPGKLAKTKKKFADVGSRLLLENSTDRDVYHEVKKSGEVDVGIYQEYLKLAGGLPLFLVVFSVFVLTQIVTTSTDDLVTSWVNLEVFAAQRNATLQERLERRREVVPSFYTLMTLLEVVISLAKYSAIFLLSRKISTKLHRKLITNIVKAPMTFFHTNLIGNILNRFSKDLVTIDEVVPLVINDLFQNFLKFVEIITMTAHINPLLLVPTSFLATLLIVFRRWCLHTGRSLKRLEAATRSPVIGHVKDTLEGMTTVKAFQAETRLKDEFNDRLDVNASACYTLQCTMKAFAFFVEIICNLYVGIVIAVLLALHDPKSFLFEDVGFVITHTFLLIQLLQRVLYEWTEVETQMTALERIFEYVDVECESQAGKMIENWPRFGEVQLENLRLVNKSEFFEPVGIIKSHEKIAISGTSDSLKSLIISRLLRLYPSHDTTIIDGVDIKTLSLNSLRSKISVLSQDPVVLAGTIRDNIDLNGKHTDEEIWRVLEAVCLKPVVCDLDSVVLEGGVNFSQGQKQLLCLARALALGNKIVIVDNITAHLDSQTKCLVRDVIKTSFSSCTCIIFDQYLCSTLRCDRNIVIKS